MATPLKPKQYFFLWAALAAALIAADQGAKLWIVNNYQLGQSTYITSFFNVVRAHNTGAAFSLLANAGGWQQTMFTIIALGVSAFILVVLWRHSTEKLMCFALSLILSGAIGNLIDRLTYGYVVDFLSFHWRGIYFPAFNLADSAICIGAGLIILSEILQIGKNKHPENQT